MTSSEFEISVSNPDFKFNCSHFIAFNGFRERIHGHTYRASIKICGYSYINNDGYLLDFADIKKIARELCKSLNENFLVPMASDVINITTDSTQICMLCQDGSLFSLPKSDCIQLPIVHSSAEEISHWFLCQLLRKIGIDKLNDRGIKNIEVSIYEAPTQCATFRTNLPKNEEEMILIEASPIKILPSSCFEI